MVDSSALPLSNESWAIAYDTLDEALERLPGELAERTTDVAPHKKSDFWGRTSVALHQRYVPVSNILVHDFSSRAATRRCLITSARAGDREWIPDKMMEEALREVGYLGRFVNYRDHFPNPTGVE